jgi:hypothetical protein
MAICSVQPGRNQATCRNISEDSKPNIHCRENLKSHCFHPSMTFQAVSKIKQRPVIVPKDYDVTEGEKRKNS